MIILELYLEKKNINKNVPTFKIFDFNISINLKYCSFFRILAYMIFDIGILPLYKS